MFECYDRSKERNEFNNTKKNIIFFTSIGGNGMTTFLYNVLNSKQYIFIKESGQGEITFDKLDRTTAKFEEIRRHFLDLKKEDLENAKIFMNLFYVFPNFGSFLQSIGLDIINSQIQDINSIKFSFADFLKTYIDIQKNMVSVVEPIYLVIDHADRCSFTFITKLKELLNYGNIKLIICLDDTVVKAEYRCIFATGTYHEIDFSKPLYKNALIIFDKTEMNSKFYDQSMYDSARNLSEFFGKYKKVVKEHIPINNVDKKIFQYINTLPCLFSLKVFEILCEYLVKNAYVDQEIDSNEVLLKLEKERVISRQGKFFKTVLPEPNIEIEPMAIGFAAYILNRYKELNYDFLYYLFTQYKEYHFVNCGLLRYLLEESYAPKEAIEIINTFKLKAWHYSDYLSICKILVDKRFYDCLYDFEGEIEYKWRLFDQLLRLIILDRKHLIFDKKEFIKLVHRCMKKYNNLDVKCMIVIIFLDFCINHNKKNVKLFFSKKSCFYYRKFEASRYYGILESIIAFYEPHTETALKLYDEAITNTDGINKIYLINNKFAYLLSMYINRNIYESETEKVFSKFDIKNNKFIIYDEFLNTNIFLYLSIKNYKSNYNIRPYLCNDGKNYQDNLKTWNLYKVLNHHILRFVFAEDFDIQEFIELEKIILSSNRAPAKNIFYYNLYLMAICFDNKLYIDRAKKFLDHNQDFIYSNINEIYKNVRRLEQKTVFQYKRNYVRFGYIFSRISSIGYLFSEIAVLNK